MRRESGELIILGAGFAGSLLACIARRIGLSVVLIERFTHPRFAIGESSTPLANHKLASLAETYGLDWLKPFAKYGPWKRAYPHVGCGLKRGFSFFRHPKGEHFVSKNHHAELLVTANPDAERGDTHWLRHDFDAFLADQAARSGVVYLDSCPVDEMDHGSGWCLRATRGEEPLEVRGTFLVDATGQGGALARWLSLPEASHDVQTSTRALYSHFEGVARWAEVLTESGVSLDDHPFPCDFAALHHIIDGGWMWVLRFDHGVTSAGFSLDTRRHGATSNTPPEEQWSALLTAYPAIGRQFRDAAPTRPFTATGRMQRRLAVAAGADWALLPNAACFTDAWLSPGIAHTLYAVERLARVLADRPPGQFREHRLADYSRSLLREFDAMDRITAACLARFDSFAVLVPLTMLYFAAVTQSEHRARSGSSEPDDEFLLAHDPRFSALVRELTAVGLKVASHEAPAFEEAVRQRLAPYLLPCLLHPVGRNMFAYEA